MPKRPHKKRAYKALQKGPQSIMHYGVLYIGTIVVTLLIVLVGYALIPTPQPCANSRSCLSDLTEKIEDDALGKFAGKTVTPFSMAELDQLPTQVLGTTTATGEKHIYVDLEKQKLYAYQGTTQIFETLVSTGRWGRTPVGNYHIWIKLKATRMSGGEGADAYDLPNVPYTMFFYGDFGIHGAYWHNNFGYPMSHGCVNMRQIDAKTVFEWADGPADGKKGTAVSICNSFSGPSTCIQTDPING